MVVYLTLVLRATPSSSPTRPPASTHTSIAAMPRRRPCCHRDRAALAGLALAFAKRPHYCHPSGAPHTASRCFLPNPVDALRSTHTQHAQSRCPEARACPLGLNDNLLVTDKNVTARYETPKNSLTRDLLTSKAQPSPDDLAMNEPSLPPDARVPVPATS